MPAMHAPISRPAGSVPSRTAKLDCSRCQPLPYTARCRPRHGHPVCAAEPEQHQEQQQSDLVRSLPKVRQAAPPPEAVAVQHSSSYLYRQRRQELGEDPDTQPRSYMTPERSWREDAEDVNAQARQGFANAAKVTADLGGRALSVAVPVGGWALRQGFKAAKGALNRNTSKPSTKRRQRRDAGDSD